MKCVVFGANGQLGRQLLRCGLQGYDVEGVSRADVDLRELAALHKFLSHARPDVIINAAAYTAVDKAESQRDLAFAVNCDAPLAMGEYAASRGSRLVHVSTDFVFDGAKSHPYEPTDKCMPLNVYGASKLAGEDALRGVAGLDLAIVRTAWVYSSDGSNFVKTMLRLFAERDVVSVVADQVGTPTAVASLTACVSAFAKNNSRGLYHWTDAGVASWYDFAVAIFEEAHALGLLTRDVNIVPIRTEEYPTPARRPSFTVLDRRTAEAEIGLRAAHWRHNLRIVLREMKQ